MSHLIQKHQLNKKGSGVIRRQYITPEQAAEFDRLRYSYTKAPSDNTRVISSRVQVAPANTPEKVSKRYTTVQTNKAFKTAALIDKERRTEQQYNLAAQQTSRSNPKSWVRDWSRIPVAGIPATIAEGLYAGGNYLTGNKGAARYWWQQANQDATGHTVGLAAIPAHTNPYTAILYDGALLGSYMRDLDLQGKFQHIERLTGSDAGNMTLAAAPFLLPFMRFESPRLRMLLLANDSERSIGGSSTFKETLPQALIDKGWTLSEDGVRVDPTGKRWVRNAEGKLLSEESLRRTNLELSRIGSTLSRSTNPASTHVDLRNYRGERLTGNEPGFDEWALTRTPENDHFPDLSHGLNNPGELRQIMNREFEDLPNGARVDLGETFSGDSSSNLLLYAYRNRNRIKMVLPEYDNVVLTNNYGIKGSRSADIFNNQLERLLDHYGYSSDAVPRAIYNSDTNTLTVPRLSFIKLYRKGKRLLPK